MASRRIVGDLAAVHSKFTAADKHAAAALISRSAAGRVAGDSAAVHVEPAVCAPHIHAAAPVATGTSVVAGTAVADDGTAVHLEYAVILHAAAAAGTGDDAALDLMAAGVVQFPPPIVFTKVIGVIAAVAVGQGKGHAFANSDGAVIAFVGDAVAVQAEYGAICGLPISADRYILVQVIEVALRWQRVGRGLSFAVLLFRQLVRPLGKCGRHIVGGPMVADRLVLRAADAVLMNRRLRGNALVLRHGRRGQHGKAERKGHEQAEYSFLHNSPPHMAPPPGRRASRRGDPLRVRGRAPGPFL